MARQGQHTARQPGEHGQSPGAGTEGELGVQGVYVTSNVRGRGMSMLLALLKQNPRNWVAYEQQTYISYGFGGWKSKVKLPTDSLPGENPLPGSCMAVVSLCLHVVAEMGELSGVSFMRAPIPFLRSLPS